MTHIYERHSKREMKRLVTYMLVGIAVKTSTPFSQQAIASYDDVAVVVNTNSGTSLAIGAYFQNARSIPSVNMVYVSVDTAEEIDTTTFDLLRSQVESHLTISGLTNSINYIVTTKGVPLKVNRGDTISTGSPSASVESELMLLLGGYSHYIGANGRITSPYYYQSVHFSRSQFGIYLVTRLDGYTLQQVLDLIDKSGPEVSVSPAAKYVFDQDPDWNNTLPSLNNYMVSAKNTLESKGKIVELDGSTTYVTDNPDVIGYTSWGSNDHYANLYTQYGQPRNAWAPGAIAETYVSTSGRTFQLPVTYGQSLIADLVAEGISGAKGYVYEPFSSAMAIPYLLFDRYTSNYNLAESFGIASRYMSWMGVVIGDPKTTIDGPPAPLPIQLYYLTAVQVANSNNVQLNWGTLSETDNYGFFVQRRDSMAPSYEDIPGSFVPGHGTTVVPQEYAWIHNNAPTGTSSYRLRQIDMDGTVHFTEGQQLTIASLTFVETAVRPLGIELMQNYPNPFNPMTTISYYNPGSGPVSLKVFTATGEEVSTLVQGIQSAGTYSVRFDVHNGENGVSSGLYIYRLTSGGKILTKKMILMK